MPARIYSMSFNTTSSLLCVSSATDTVHIFKLGVLPPEDDREKSKSPIPSDDKRERSLSPGGSDSDLARSPSLGPESISSSSRKHNGTLLGMIRRTSQNVGTSFAASVGSYLPSAVSEMWEPARDFAWLKIPKATPPAGSGLSTTSPLRSVVALSSNSPQVMVVTNDGHFYVYGIDLEKGGEGTLVKVFEVGGEGERIGGGNMED